MLQTGTISAMTPPTFHVENTVLHNVGRSIYIQISINDWTNEPGADNDLLIASFIFLVKGAALKYIPTIVNDVKLVFDPKELR